MGGRTIKNNLKRKTMLEKLLEIRNLMLTNIENGNDKILASFYVNRLDTVLYELHNGIELVKGEILATAKKGSKLRLENNPEASAWEDMATGMIETMIKLGLDYKLNKSK